MTRGFDRLAGVYRLLEYAAYGRALERTRFCLLDRLASSRRVLLLGDGDGRCLARLVRIAPAAEIHSVDASAAMLARAAARLSDAERRRVTFHHLDVLAAPLPPGPYDAVTTMFFLDCFDGRQTRDLIARIAAVLDRDASWLWADFRIPERGVARLWARATVALLYAFFRWETGIAARELPPAEAAIEEAGFDRVDQRDLYAGIVRAARFVRGEP